MKTIKNNFKPYLKPSKLYLGGMTRDEVLDLIGDKKLYKLSSNENILGPSPKAVEAIKNNLHLISEYPDRTDIELRKALAKYYDNVLGPEQFMTANSGSEMIEIVARAFINEGDEFIVSNPCFKPYQMFCERMGGQQIDVKLDPETYAVNFDAIIEEITPKTKVIFLTSPNNPTGTYIPYEEMKAFLDKIPSDITVVIDEVYAFFADAEDFQDARNLVNEGYNVIALNSFSKVYGLAGLRLGYGYTTPEIAEYLHALYRPFPLSTLVLEAGKAALGDSEYIQESTELIKKERSRIYTGLDEIGMKYWASQANFVLMKPEMDDEELTHELLKEGIMVRPVSGFGAPGCIRVTVGDKAANVAFLEALKKVYRPVKS